jgi:4-hydroxybenzoate polyprenyltransferase
LIVLSQYLIRPRAWWFNKIPLSVTVILLLGEGSLLAANAVVGFLLTVLTVCAVANYGYALNELYDVEEDFRAGRANATERLSPSQMKAVIAASAIIAVTLATFAAGWPGAMLTAFELIVPFAYSVPPLRVKERKWLGVAADAIAAHVYPVALALLAADYLWEQPVSAFVAICLLTWSTAAGLRGILSHQLHTAERDRQGGLQTIVHDWGHVSVERLIILVLLPIEVVGFMGAVAGSRTGAILWVLGGLYLVCEVFRTLDRRFAVFAFRPQGQSYLPFVEESFYKAWGPIVIALDAARVDLRYLAVIPLYALLFQPHLRNEAHKLLAIGRALRDHRTLEK